MHPDANENGIQPSEVPAGAARWRAALSLAIAIHKRVLVARTLHVLPFCALGAVFVERPWRPGEIAAILLCAVFARATAVGCSRAFRAPADVSNPVPPPGQLPRTPPPPPGVWAAFALHGAAVFIFLAFMLNRAAGYGAVAVAALLAIQSAARPRSGLSHLILGAVLGSAPLAGWIAFMGLDREPLPAGLIPLAAGVALWAAGFDMLYSMRAEARDAPGPGSYRNPMAVSKHRAVQIAWALQTGAVALFAAAICLLPLHAASLGGPAATGACLVFANTRTDAPGWIRATPRFMLGQLATGPLLLAAFVAGRIL